MAIAGSLTYDTKLDTKGFESGYLFTKQNLFLINAKNAALVYSQDVLQLQRMRTELLA